jgi:RNA polymerase primary sigma factor
MKTLKSRIRKPSSPASRKPVVVVPTRPARLARAIARPPSAQAILARTEAKLVALAVEQAAAEPVVPVAAPVAARVTVPAETSAGSSNGERSGPLTLYLREVGLVSLLTPDEEVSLAAKVKKGDEKARERMITANLRLVVKIARDYEHFGLPLLDLINEGNIGLMKAVNRFDPTKGAKFSTYSSWWIKQAIKRALANQSKTIRLPVHLVDKIAHMRRVAMRLHDVLGHEPTDDELAAELGIKVSRVAEWRSASQRPSSLDAPIGDDDSHRLADIVRDERVEDPCDTLANRTIAGKLSELVEKLHPREATILRFRFGLDGGPERTLEEVGRKFGVTRERIRQLQNLALTKLRRMIEDFEAVQEVAA